jgi:glyoxylase-like metal-dependent hydrolase (beta-lactamase superfamily II)
VILETRAAEPFYKNGFVLGCEETREGVLIDPGDEVEDLLELVQQHRLTMTRILLTHAHLDHISGVGRAKRVLQVPVILHAADVPLYEAVVQQGAMFGLHVEPQPPVDELYRPDQVIRFGHYDVRPHHTPGHCPGGVCLQVGPVGTVGQQLFVGDTLFAGSIGRTDLPGGDHATLLASIRHVLFAFGDEAIVYPGHGPATTIGEERRTNPFLQDRC